LIKDFRSEGSRGTARATTSLNRLLDLSGVTVAGVSFPASSSDSVVVEVAAAPAAAGLPSLPVHDPVPV
jgi:hypothetical protein